jgi:hypothetical protein
MKCGIVNAELRVVLCTLPFALCTLSFEAVAALPDLMIYGPSTEPEIIYRTFSSNDCEVVEGCATTGTRRLLSFNSECRNLGPVDLNMGDPANNPLFEWAPCHGHYHFEDFAIYRLLNASGSNVVTGHKMAFCMEDTIRWSPSAGTTRLYSCNRVQGIQAGWADVYDKAVPCQFVDITGLPDGNYILEMTLDPHNYIAESTKTNNVTRVPVTIGGACTPANDSFANAIALTGVAVSIIGNNVCATKETGEPNHAGETGGHSVWYQWRAPYSGNVMINTVGSDFDTLLAVYTGGSVNALTLIAQNDDIVPTVQRQSQVTFNAISNTTYRIAVDGWNGEVGGIFLNVNPPINDAFANCTTISGAAGSINGHNIGATKEPGELAHAENIGGHSVWYCWTAPTNGVWTFDTIGSDFDTLLAVYTGNSVTNLTRIASDDDSGGNFRSRLAFNAVRGTTYHIVVDGSSGRTGTIVLRWANMISVSARRVPTGIEVTCVSTPGTYQLQGSTNLNVWTTLTTFNTAQATNRYIDTQNSRMRFYRAVRP